MELYKKARAEEKKEFLEVALKQLPLMLNNVI